MLPANPKGIIIDLQHSWRKGGEEESRGAFTMERDFAFKTLRGKKKINHSLEAKSEGDKAPVLPQAAREQKHDFPAQSQQMMGKFLQSPSL